MRQRGLRFDWTIVSLPEHCLGFQGPAAAPERRSDRAIVPGLEPHRQDRGQGAYQRLIPATLSW